jgi:hypothetical protein
MAIIRTTLADVLRESATASHMHPARAAWFGRMLRNAICSSAESIDFLRTYAGPVDVDGAAVRHGLRLADCRAALARLGTLQPHPLDAGVR